MSIQQAKTIEPFTAKDAKYGIKIEYLEFDEVIELADFAESTNHIVLGDEQ